MKFLHFLQLGWHSTNVSQKEIALQVGTSESRLGGTPLEKQYSPEQIVGTLKKENTETVSHEWIYQYIYQDKKNGGKLLEN
jgi:hypothetical protein